MLQQGHNFEPGQIEKAQPEASPQRHHCTATKKNYLIQTMKLSFIVTTLSLFATVSPAMGGMLGKKNKEERDLAENLIGVKPIIPEDLTCVCPQVYAPVCGSDGKTYSNQCFLKCNTSNDVSIKCEGECPCTTKPPLCQCADVDQPVCGADGKSYDSPCLATCAPTKVMCKGKCPCPNPDPEPVCIPKGQSCQRMFLDTMASMEEMKEGIIPVPKRCCPDLSCQLTKEGYLCLGEQVPPTPTPPTPTPPICIPKGGNCENMWDSTAIKGEADDAMIPVFVLRCCKGLTCQSTKAGRICLPTIMPPPTTKPPTPTPPPPSPPICQRRGLTCDMGERCCPNLTCQNTKLGKKVCRPPPVQPTCATRGKSCEKMKCCDDQKLTCQQTKFGAAVCRPPPVNPTCIRRGNPCGRGLPCCDNLTCQVTKGGVLLCRPPPVKPTCQTRGMSCEDAKCCDRLVCTKTVRFGAVCRPPVVVPVPPTTPPVCKPQGGSCDKGEACCEGLFCYSFGSGKKCTRFIPPSTPPPREELEPLK